MRIDVKKTYHGCIDLRDYVVKRCINDGESIDVHHAGYRMTLTPEQLKKDVVATSPLMKSKIEGGRDYYLFSYKWNPQVTKKS